MQESPISFHGRREPTLLLQRFKLWGITKKVGTIPTSADELAKYNKKNVKAKRILLDAIKKHIIPHATSKKNDYEMWETIRI